MIGVKKMKKLMRKLGVCTLIMGLGCGLSFAVSAAPMNEVLPQPAQQTWSVQEQEQQSLELKQKEIWRHEQAMLQRGNESVSDWEWRQWQEREQHIRNMQKQQDDGLKFVGTPVNW